MSVTGRVLPPGPVSRTRHQWPCPRFYVLAMASDQCNCGRVCTETSAAAHMLSMSDTPLFDALQRRAPIDLPFVIDAADPMATLVDRLGGRMLPLSAEPGELDPLTVRPIGSS